MFYVNLDDITGIGKFKEIRGNRIKVIRLSLYRGYTQISTNKWLHCYIYINIYTHIYIYIYI